MNKTDLAAVVTGEGPNLKRTALVTANEYPFLFLYLQIDFNTAQNGPNIRLLSRANSFNVSVLEKDGKSKGKENRCLDVCSKPDGKNTIGGLRAAT